LLTSTRKAAVSFAIGDTMTAAWQPAQPQPGERTIPPGQTLCAGHGLAREGGCGGCDCRFLVVSHEMLALLSFPVVFLDYMLVTLDP
jgi:hypothetical protein